MNLAQGWWVLIEALLVLLEEETAPSADRCEAWVTCKFTKADYFLI